MKKCFGIIIIAFSALGMASCSEDFDVAAQYKNITVVYGLMNYGDAVQYIRVQKAFLDPTQSALTVAKNADSNYYRNIEVHMKEMVNGTVLNDDLLPRVNMADEGLPKDSGTFFSSPSYAYKYTRRLNAAATYRVTILNKETGNVDSADTKVIDTASNVFSVTDFNRTTALPLSFESNSKTAKYVLKINSLPPNGRLFEGYIRFNYVNIINGVQKDTFFVWNFNTMVGSGTSLDLTTTTSEFFNVFKSNIKYDGNVQERKLDSADIFIWAGDDNYYNYLVNTQSSGGLTADQIRPNYTTIRGRDVLGLFGARTMKIRYDIPISTLSLDSLIRNKDLQFTGRSDH